MFSRLHSRIRIISKIAAERNGDTVLTPIEIEEYCGERTSDLLFFLQSYESANYTYDRQLDVFILGDDSIAGRVQSSIEALPEIVKSSQLGSVLGEAAEEADVPLEMLEKAFIASRERFIIDIDFHLPQYMNVFSICIILKDSKHMMVRRFVVLGRLLQLNMET